tara:strand:+ start:163 stop:360 length:198 start_codon:yes stop_codon:yes gene_type:complete
MQMPFPIPVKSLEPIGTNKGESKMHSGYGACSSKGASSTGAFATFLQAVSNTSAVLFLKEYRCLF